MKISEIVRVVLALQSSGWEEKAIIDFLLYVTTGENRQKTSAPAAPAPAPAPAPAGKK